MRVPETALLTGLDLTVVEIGVNLDVVTVEGEFGQFQVVIGGHLSYSYFA
jgi:hypothetical protein